MALADADREALYARLSAHAAADHIDLAELERRIAAVDAADTRERAFAVIADLPPLSVGGGASAGGSGAGASGAATSPAGPGSGWPRWGRGHGDADRPREGWLPTPERFRDPRSGRVMRVWEDEAGGRHYLPDGG
jgi:hypothetical protein